MERSWASRGASDEPDALETAAALATARIRIDGQAAAAAGELESLHARQVAALGRDDPRALRTLVNLGAAYGAAGQHARAVTVCKDGWTGLAAKLGADHPHALFAANNLGQHEFDPKQPERETTIKPGESVTFRHRVVILDGTADAARMNEEHRTFAAMK